ncbi:hypothetical protein BKA61DRAFT_614844 [Leptodontidium sp. MPI-SDFR-AT-0119]|nr:hypothetical protein BKA61DRAFT_614844 [Leptodontidium sp. MPI-SDFR-AT-0119]
MPKRSFAEFRESYSYSNPLSTSTLGFIFTNQPPTAFDHPSPPSSNLSHDPLLQSKYQPVHRSPRRSPPTESPDLPRLKRCSSLPDLNTLRKLCPVVSLTAANLTAMGPNNAPMTPDRTASGSKSSTGSSEADNGRRMGLVGLLDDTVGKARLKERPELQDTVHTIVGGERESSMKAESAQRFEKTLGDIQTRNEATIAERLMPFLIKKERTVTTGLSDEYNYDGDSTRRIQLRSFELDHLDWNINKDFYRDAVPFPPNQTNNRLFFGIKNPKPDITYGIQYDAFTSEEQKGLLDFEPELSEGIVSPFLVVEWKGFKGSMQMAKDQTRRAGAAMVQSRRKAVGRLSVPPTGHDLDQATMVFTCVINDESAHINVHWAEQNDQGEMEWLVHVVKRFHLQEDEDPKLIRRALHNIIEWGITERKRTVKAQLGQYMGQPPLDPGSPSTKRRRRDKSVEP